MRSSRTGVCDYSKPDAGCRPSSRHGHSRQVDGRSRFSAAARRNRRASGMTALRRTSVAQLLRSIGPLTPLQPRRSSRHERRPRRAGHPGARRRAPVRLLARRMGLLVGRRERRHVAHQLRLPRPRRQRRRRELDGRPSLDFQGLSFSVYDRSAGRWKQTWVDSQGSYLDFAAASRTASWSFGVQASSTALGRSSGCAGEHRTGLVRLVLAALGGRRRDLDPLWEIEDTRVV